MASALAAPSPFVDPMVASDPTAKLRRPAKAMDPVKARQTAEEFEAVFIAQMMAPMFKGIKTDGLMGGGHGEEMFRSLLLNEYGKNIAKAGGFGIADTVYREMLRQQEAGPRARPTP
ncbi:MAG: hypothetical protein OHK0024_15020 [Thalassobaculales bacterium]